jgi:hypothetical protein
MALKKSNLKSDIESALQSGMDGASKAEVANKLAKAIVDYASGAEITISGPVVIPPPTGPSPSSANGRKVKILPAIASAGIGLLTPQIVASFNAMDQMATITTAIVSYAATFTSFPNPSVGAVTGATVMSVPPVFAPVVAAGLAGASIGETANLMSSIIHTSFSSAVFTGVVTAVDLGVGPTVGPLM